VAATWHFDQGSYTATMKSILFLCLALSGLLIGCGDQSGKPAHPANATTNDGSLVTAPVDYLNSITKAEQSAIKTFDVSAVNSAIKQFQVEQGRYPQDLNELVQQKYLPPIPPVPYGTKLVYDPATGEAKVVKQQ
jgi:hypothetical protein